MKEETKQIWKAYAIGLIWLFGLLWPLLGIHEDGTLGVSRAFRVWLYVFGGTAVILAVYFLHRKEMLHGVIRPVLRLRDKAGGRQGRCRCGCGS